RSMSRIDSRANLSRTVVKTVVRRGLRWVVASTRFLTCSSCPVQPDGAPRLGSMTVRRVMGIETEYGISVPGDPTANPMLLSGYVVNAYASLRGSRAGRAGWDYEDEMPLRDARGFE